ncbi:MAG: hypothetical protein V1834_00360 [Candidatus Micrarchaeota archaeon]
MALKGQAAIYDGIMFLLLAAFSSALIFSFIQGFGTQQDRVMRSAFQLNQMQTVFKAIHYVDVNSLQGVSGSEYRQAGVGGIVKLVALLEVPGDSSTVVYPGDPGDPLDLLHYPRYASSGVYSEMDCDNLKLYPRGITVADLLKKDLADNQLDNKFGTVAIAPGRLALRCALKELMQPISYAGFKYLAEVRSAEDPSVGISVINPSFAVTNSVYLRNQPWFTSTSTCSDIQANLELNLFAVSTPFAVTVEEYDAATNTHTSLLKDFVLTICVWAE